MAAAEPADWVPPDIAVPAVAAAQEAHDVWNPAEPQRKEAAVLINPGEMPTLRSLRCTSTLSGAARSSKARAGGRRHMSGEPNYVAALGGMLALTGSVLSYTIARVKHGKRVRNLEKGLQANEHALAATKEELQHAKKQLATLTEAEKRRQDLEAELHTSREKLEHTTQELEAARAEKRKTERDYKVVKDQLNTVATSKQRAAKAIAAADKARQDAEKRWNKAYADLDAAQKELENVKGELGLRGSQLQGLTRELEFTRRQLLEAEKRVERAQMESRSARTGYGADYDLPSWS